MSINKYRFILLIIYNNSVLSPITQAWSDLRPLVMVALSCARTGAASRPNLTHVDLDGLRGFLNTRVSMAWCARRRV